MFSHSAQLESQIIPRSDPDQQQPIVPSSSLYLFANCSLNFTFWPIFFSLSIDSFTFLATLFVLLSISVAIILRSYLVRRRFNRDIHVALGVPIPGTNSDARPSRRLGERPILHDVLLKVGSARWKDIWVCGPHLRLTLSALIATSARIGPATSNANLWASHSSALTYSLHHQSWPSIPLYPS